jgi:hypothetical protein
MISNLTVKIGADIEGLQRELNRATGQLNSFNKNLTNIASTLGIAFGVKELADFTVEISKLAGEAKGVKDAFDRLPNSIRLLEEMKEATGNTVSELALMKRAVQADNFEISLQALPKLLEFATLRAQQTGQSVDYLVDSIITGIGRKSKLILDNLGISAVQLNAALKGASMESATVGQVADAVGQIAESNLKKMAKFSDNASTKMQQLSAEWENFKVTLGGSSNQIGLLNDSLETMTSLLKNMGVFLESQGGNALLQWLKLVTLIPRGTLKAADGTLAWLNNLRSLESAVKNFNEEFGNKPFAGRLTDTEDFNDALADLEEKAMKAGKKIVLLSDGVKTMAVIKPFTETVTTLTAEEEKQIQTYEDLQSQLKELNTQFETATDRNDQKELKNIGDKIIAIKAQIEALDKLRQAQKSKLKLEFIPDLEAEGSTNPELRNMQAANEAKEFAKSLEDVGHSAAFAGGQLVQLDKTTENTQKTMSKTINIAETLSGAVAGFTTDIANAIGEAASGAQSFGESLLEAVGRFAQQFGAALIASGVAAIAAKTLLTNPGLAIGAGVALVAIGASLAAAASSAHNSMMGSGGGGRGGSGSSGSDISPGIEIKVTGEWRIQGNDLVLVFNRQQQLDGRTKG